MNPKIMFLKLFKWPLFFVALFLSLALGAEILINTWGEQKLLAGALKGILPFFKYGLFGLAAATVKRAMKPPNWRRKLKRQSSPKKAEPRLMVNSKS